MISAKNQGVSNIPALTEYLDEMSEAKDWNKPHSYEGGLSSPEWAHKSTPSMDALLASANTPSEKQTQVSTSQQTTEPNSGDRVKEEYKQTERDLTQILNELKGSIER
jgi:hypothetical protein